MSPADEDRIMHEYARVIVDGAERCGIAVRIVDRRRGELELTLGDRTVRTRESLSEATSGFALDRCQDKWAVRRTLLASDCQLPKAQISDGDDGDLGFLAEVGALVAKPARGAEGRGVSLNIRTATQLKQATGRLRAGGITTVILEEMCVGVEVRILCIDFTAVAAILRTPPTITGDGEGTIRDLVEARNRDLRRSLGPAAGIEIDLAVQRTLASQGVGLGTVPEIGSELVVRFPTSLSADRLAGGTVQDVTELLHPSVMQAAEQASRALDMPVLGLDMILTSVSDPHYFIIDANERPGLSNYGQQPVVDRFLELLFPRLRGTP